MAIQRPNLDKFKKAPSTSKNNEGKDKKSDGGNGDIFMQMGKALLPKIPKKFKYIIGVAVFFLAWGFVSFNYYMIQWLSWAYFFVIVAVLIAIQLIFQFKTKK